MELLSHRYHEDRPWGSFERFTENEISTVKILHALPNKRLSLQKHAKRSEFWKVLEGTGVARVGDDERTIGPGDEVQIPVGSLHRISSGENGITWLEISLGEFDENDIERVEDDFGRVS